MVDIFGYKNLTDYEKRLVDVETGYAKHAAKSGCLLQIMITIVFVIILIILF